MARGAPPVFAYTLEYIPAEPPRWSVTLEASGLDPASGPWELVLDGWGGWTDLGRPYVLDLKGRPAINADGGTIFSLDIPPDWDGTLRASYTLPVLAIGTDEQRQRTILPAACETYTCGAIQNTLMYPRCAGAAVAGTRTVTISGPPLWDVFTGWAGLSTGPQTSTLPPAGENGVIAIGRAAGTARAEENGLAFEVVQFAAGPAVARKVLDVARPLVTACSRTLAWPVREPVRVCVTGATGGGYLTDHGLVVGLPPGSDEWTADSPYFKQLVCHELFHLWLGHVLREQEPERTVWFKEGFTDYLALWHGAAAGVLPRAWFLQRLREIEDAGAGSSLGKVAFADAAVTWRDGDGPNEVMAYKGGALLALALDAELRGTGHAGLPALLREMLASGSHRYSGATIREHVQRLGLGDFDRRFIAGTEVPAVEKALLRLGYARRTADTRLAYIGLRTEDGPGFGRVVEIDPDGPAAGAGFRIGDIIGGLAPARTDHAEVKAQAGTPFGFGLTMIDLTEEPVSVWVHRAQEQAEIKVRPRLIPGGVRSELAAPPEVEDRFFSIKE